MKHPPLLYVLKYKIKLNPSPNENGFVLNLFDDPTVNYPNTIKVVVYVYMDLDLSF